MSWIVPELGRLSREHPHLTLHLYFGSGEDLLHRLLAAPYMVADDLQSGRLKPLLRRAELARDHFRLVFPREDSRRDVYRALAESRPAVPIR
jgi:DNA-binding transcriptional LysR family regulator